MSKIKKTATLPEQRHPNRFDIHYVKRPDLRPHEFPPDLSPEEFDAARPAWDLLIGTLELGREITSDNQNAIASGPSMVALRPWTRAEKIDPWELLEYFCSCHQAKVYPPAWVMNALYEIFDEYLTARAQGQHKTLGEWFGENRARDWQRVTASMMEEACYDVHRLQIWFSRPRTRALDIAACRLEAAQTSKQLPSGWLGRTKTKRRGALEKEYDRQRPSIEKVFKFWDEHCPSTIEDHNKLLLRLGEEALIGEQDLLGRLRELEKNPPTKI